ncbi:MAG: 6-carboxytetrahydropterin synthase [Spirochaetaceae bacterium]|nr:MAG: 6-carboxytetrahydropterin synthase [Spirochaetaceae bacterium]
MYQVGIKNKFRASHFLIGDFAEETLPHEHEYLVEWICSTNVLDENGFSVDIAVLEEELQRLIDDIQGKRLNDLEFFKDRQVSVENLAHFVCTALVDALNRRSFSLRSIQEFQVKIWESETAWAAYLQT